MSEEDPSVFDRVLAMLVRLSPPWPSTAEDTSVGKELGSIAAALTPAAERLDDMWGEIFPDTASETLARWEAITKVPSRTGDDDSVRQARVLGVLRRVAGPRIDQLGPMLIAPLDCAVEDLVFVEQMRSYITEKLTLVRDRTYGLGASPVTIPMHKPWPGVIDDNGVRLRVKLGAFYTPDIVLRHMSGVEWQVPVDTDDAWYENRDDFEGLPASGRWEVIASDPAVVDLERLELMVSNDVDSAQIYNFFCYRDPDIAGDPDYREARRLFARTAHGHNNSQLTERERFIVGDTHSVVGREPMGDG